METIEEDTTLSHTLPDSLKLLYTCLHAFGFFSKSKLKRYVTISVSCLLGVMIMMIDIAQFTNIKGDVSKFVDNLESIFAYIQILGKVTALLFVQNDLIIVFKDTRLFWKYNRCDEEIQRKLNLLSHYIIYIQKAVAVILAGTVSFATILALIKKTHIIGIWTLEGHRGLYNFKTVASPFTFLVYVPILYGVDCIFLTLCAETVIQFRILCQCLKNLGTDYNNNDGEEFDYAKKVIACIQYHQFLLRFAKRFLNAFSFILMAEFVTVGPLVCAELYAVSESTGIQIQMKHGLLFVYFVVQLFCWCIPANYITNEAAKVANAVYFSNWYAHDVRLLKVHLLIMIQNAQNEILVKGGGLITINAATALNVLKAAWSLTFVMKGFK